MEKIKDAEKVKGEFSLNVTGLTDYVKENETPLLTRSLFGGKTIDLITSEGTLMLGIKSTEKVSILETDAIFQDGTGCTRTSSGSTSLTQRQITVGTIAVVEDICVADLEKKYTANQLARGANTNKLPFEQEYSNLKADTVAKQLEIAVWRGDTAHGDVNLNKFDGFIKIIDAASGVIQSNAAAYIETGAPISVATGITLANVKAVVNSVWLALPAGIMGKEDVRIFCGWDVFNKFINAYTNQNLFNFAPTGKEVKQENGEVYIPGTTYLLTAVHGLDGTNRLFGGRMPNFVFGTDMESDYENFSMMEDQFKDYLRFKMRFRSGVQVGFPDEIVTFKLV